MKNKKEKRFVSKLTEGNVGQVQIIVDKETGVNYLFCCQGYAGGLTVLVDREGKPIVSSTSEIEEME